MQRWGRPAPLHASRAARPLSRQTPGVVRELTGGSWRRGPLSPAVDQQDAPDLERKGDGCQACAGEARGPSRGTVKRAAGSGGSGWWVPSQQSLLDWFPLRRGRFARPNATRFLSLVFFVDARLGEAQ